MQTLHIEPKGDKGRVFQAQLLAYVRSDNWSGSDGGSAIRPCWMALAGSQQELRAFVTNLTQGNAARTNPSNPRSGTRFEVLKSAGFEVAWQRTEYGSVATLYYPDLFRRDPGLVDPSGARFVVLPATDWLAAPDPARHAPKEYASDLKKLAGKDAWGWVQQLAPHFIEYLDRRTRLPIAADPRYHERVLCAALVRRRAEFARPGLYAAFNAINVEDVGYGPGLSFKASHDTIEDLLSTTAAEHFGGARRAA